MATQLARLPVRLAESVTCNVFYVQRRLGADRLGEKALLKHIGGLVDGFGFPPPMPCFVKGRGTVAELVIGSRWRRDAVDQWFDRYLPTSLGEAIEARQAAEAGDEMDARAASLGGERRRA